jgi:hypothetical protein
MSALYSLLARFLSIGASVATLSLRAEPNPAWTPLLDPELSQWEVWMGAPHPTVQGLPDGIERAEHPKDGTPMGLNNDPKKVFSVSLVDGQPVLHITGEIWGGLTTLQTYGNYHFSAEVKFGEKKYPPRESLKRDSGFLYHCTGPHGRFWNIWKRCVEFQVQETDIGDLIMLAGTSGQVRTNKIEKEAPLWDPSVDYVKIGRVRRIADFENPHGEWTKIEVYAIGNQAIHLVNGHVVLAIDDIRVDGAPLTEGQLQIQCESAEVYYRDMKIRPINTFPAALAKSANL